MSIQKIIIIDNQDKKNVLLKAFTYIGFNIGRFFQLGTHIIHRHTGKNEQKAYDTFDWIDQAHHHGEREADKKKQNWKNQMHLREMKCK